MAKPIKNVPGNHTEKESVITVSPKYSDTRWVAVDLNDKIISEGKVPKEAIDEAKKITNDFMIMFVPVEGNTYII